MHLLARPYALVLVSLFDQAYLLWHRPPIRRGTSFILISLVTLPEPSMKVIKYSPGN